MGQLPTSFLRSEGTSRKASDSRIKSEFRSCQTKVGVLTTTWDKNRPTWSPMCKKQKETLVDRKHQRDMNKISTTWLMVDTEVSKSESLDAPLHGICWTSSTVWQDIATKPWQLCKSWPSVKVEPCICHMQLANLVCWGWLHETKITRIS